MDKKYGKQGLRIIGLEMQESKLADIQKIVDEKKITYPITRGMGQEESDDATQPEKLVGIPHAVVFDTNGKKVYEGSSFVEDFEKAVVAALKGVKKE